MLCDLINSKQFEYVGRIKTICYRKVIANLYVDIYLIIRYLRIKKAERKRRREGREGGR